MASRIKKGLKFIEKGLFGAAKIKDVARKRKPKIIPIKKLSRAQVIMKLSQRRAQTQARIERAKRFREGE
jgi:hypothetical protein